MKRYLFLILAVVSSLTLSAQRRVTVYNLDTNKPERNVWLWADTRKCDSTNYRGQTTSPELFDTRIVSKRGFVALKIPFKMVTDSIPLLPDAYNIGEVVIYGTDRTKRLQKRVDEWTKEEKTEYALQHPITGINFNLGTVFNAKARRQKKQLKKQREVFRQLDDMENNPYIQVYQEAIRRKQQQ